MGNEDTDEEDGTTDPSAEITITVVLGRS